VRRGEQPCGRVEGVEKGVDDVEFTVTETEFPLFRDDLEVLCLAL
jgi:hypothetical protein